MAELQKEGLIFWGSDVSENEIAAIGSLRTVATVQAQFREGDREGDSSLDYATSMAELSQVGLIDEVLGSGTKSGYLFSLSGSTYSWRAAATPVDEDSGKRNFVICTDGMVRFATLEAAATFGWAEFAGRDGLRIGIDHFGASAPWTVIAAEWGFTPEAVAQRIADWLDE